MWYKEIDVDTLRAAGELALFLIVKFFLGGGEPPPVPPQAPLTSIRERRVILIFVGILVEAFLCTRLEFYWFFFFNGGVCSTV